MSFFAGQIGWWWAPPLLAAEGIRRLTNPQDIVVQRALRHIRPRLRDRTPAVVETRVRTWQHRRSVYVYLVCSLDNERSALAAQLPEMRQQLARAMPRTPGARASPRDSNSA